MHVSRRSIIWVTAILLVAGCGGGGQSTSSTLPQSDGSGSSLSGAAAKPVTLGAVVANPTSLQFVATGEAAAQTFSVSQKNYTGTFSAATSGNDPAAISISVSGDTVTVTPEKAGKAKVVVTGGDGKTVSVSVGVTNTSVDIH
jgi:pyruvate/2-oxoacid:ferredoxin oxidoreductase beta subunit